MKLDRINDMQKDISFIHAKKGSLAGHLLVATPGVQDSCFSRSVIYMCTHNEAGAMGIIINSPVRHVHTQDIMDQLEIKSSDQSREFIVHFGGPVEANRGFVVHSTDYRAPGVIAETEGVAVTSNAQVLQELALGRGPKDGFLALGYAGWSPGQLEAEIESGSWILVAATEQLVLKTENDLKWNMAVATLGFDIGNFHSAAGHA